MKVWTATYTHHVDDAWSVTHVGKTKQEALDRLQADFVENGEEGDENKTLKELTIDGYVEAMSHTL